MLGYKMFRAISQMHKKKKQRNKKKNNELRLGLTSALRAAFQSQNPKPKPKRNPIRGAAPGAMHRSWESLCFRRGLRGQVVSPEYPGIVFLPATGNSAT